MSLAAIESVSTLLYPPTALAAAVAAVVLADVLPSSVRAPASAARSATDWHWFLATATMPMSTARATNPQRATMEMARMGRIVPRRTRASLVRIGVLAGDGCRRGRPRPLGASAIDADDLVRPGISST